MKNIFFTFLFGGLMTVSAFASAVTVTFPGNKNYQVVIDGRNIRSNDYYGNSIRLNHLRQGRHSIQIYKANANKRRNANQVVYASDFTTKPQYDLFITVDNRGRVQMDERRNTDYRRNDDNWGNNGYGNNRRNDNYGRNNGGYDNGGGNNNYNRAMSDADFSQLEKKIRGQWFGKLNTAKDAVGRNYFTTYQVRQILQIFSPENDKLELAKLAYKNTVDQNNFRQLYDLFSYQKQAELDSYTRAYNR